MRATFGDIQDLVSICEHGDTRSFFAGRTVGQPIGPVDQYRVFKGIRDLDSWANGVLAQPEVAAAAQTAHSNRAFNEQLVEDDPFLGNRTARLQSEAEHHIELIYPNKEQAIQRFDTMVRDTGFDAALALVASKPGKLGQMVGSGGGIFSDRQRQQARARIEHYLVPCLKDLHDAQRAHGKQLERAQEAGGFKPVDDQLLAFERATVRLGYSMNMRDRMANAATRLRGELESAISAMDDLSIRSASGPSPGPTS
ncbi:MAG: hypothetical protein AAF556_13065 [Pseudomonadota bacterium]